MDDFDSTRMENEDDEWKSTQKNVYNKNIKRNEEPASWLDWASDHDNNFLFYTSFFFIVVWFTFTSDNIVEKCIFNISSTERYAQHSRMFFEQPKKWTS